MRNLTIRLAILFTSVNLLNNNDVFSQQINLVENLSGNAEKNQSSGEKDRVFIYGVGSTDALDLDKLTAAGGLSGAIKPNPRTTITLNFNYSGVISKKESSDSVKLNSLYFPDIASSAFAGSFELALTGFRKYDTAKEFKDNWNSFTDTLPNQLLFCLEGSFQERKIEKDSLLYNLGMTNINGGLKYRWTYYGKNKNKAVFTLGALYNGVFINSNNDKTFNSLFKDETESTASLKNIDRVINGFSLLASLQLNNTIIYFRTFDDVDRSEELAFSVGIKVTGSFFSF
jgi:hypothetical protein